MCRIIKNQRRVGALLVDGDATHFLQLLHSKSPCGVLGANKRSLFFFCFTAETKAQRRAPKVWTRVVTTVDIIALLPLSKNTDCGDPETSSQANVS